MLLDEGVKRCGPHEGDIPVHQQHGARLSAEQRFCLEHGMARPELRLLQRKLNRWTFLKYTAYLFWLMTNNNDQRCWLQGINRTEHVFDQRETGDAVYDFGERGLHAGALASGEHQDVKIGHWVAASAASSDSTTVEGERGSEDFSERIQLAKRVEIGILKGC
jgi:hypothetical protein